MKTTHLLITAAAISLGLASCSQDEPVAQNNGRAIAFRPAITRATEITNANLSSIKVAAFMGDETFFAPLEFVKGTDDYFTSTPEYNWPGDDTELTFYAYAPVAMTGITLDSDSKKLTDFSPATSISDQVDFITANATGNESQNEAGGVELSFQHRLSQIEVRAKADNEAYTFKITGMRVAQPIAKGDFDFTTNDWTLGSDKAVYEETYTTPVTLSSNPVSIMGEEGNAMIIPQQLTAWNPETDASNTADGAYLAVKLQINTIAGAQVYPFASDENCRWAAIPLNTNLEAGKKYIYTLDLSHGAGYVDPKDPQPGTPILGGPIKFTVNVLDWTNADQDLSMKTGENK